jgi:hypothetical protein
MPSVSLAAANAAIRWDTGAAMLFLRTLVEFRRP